MHKRLTETTYGSGTITRVAEGKVYILTNRHVLGDGQVTIHFYSGQSTRGEIVWLAPGDIDFAFVVCHAETNVDFPGITVLDGQMNPGNGSFAVGNPMHLPWTYTNGAISSVRSRQYGERTLYVYQTQTPINPGSSGGGLYSEDGVLIGVNTWTEDKAVSEGINFSITTMSLLDLLREEELHRFIREIATIGQVEA